MNLLSPIMRFLKKSSGMNQSSRKYPVYPMILIAIFLVLAASIAYGGYRHYLLHRERITREKYHELEAVAGMKCDQVVAWRRERLSDNLLFLENQLFTEAVARFFLHPSSASSREQIRRWLLPVSENRNFHSIVIFDEHLRERLTIGVENTPVGKMTRNQVAAAFRSGDRVVTDFHYGDAISRIHIDVIIPLVVHRGSVKSVVGMILVRVDPSHDLFPLIRSWPAPSSTAETYLVRREGDAVVFLNELRHRKGTALSLRLPLTSKGLPEVHAVLGHDGAFQGIDYRGMAVFSVIKKVPGSDWVLVAKVDADEIVAPVRLEARVVALLSVVLILLAGVSVGLIWRHERVRYYRRLYHEERAHHALSQHVERLNRLYHTQSRVSQAIVHCREQRELFGEVCRILVEDGGFRMAWIGLADGVGAPLIPAACAGHNDGYLEKVRVSTDTAPSGLGPSGRAVREGRHVVCHDIATDLSMQPWREEALKRGYRCSAAFPLFQGRDCVGTLNVYAAEADSFSGEIIRLLDEIAADVSFALVSLSTAATLSVSEKRFKQISELMTDFTYSCVRHSDECFKLDWMTGAVERITGYSPEDVCRQGCWRKLVVEEDLPIFDEKVTGLPPGTSGVCEVRIHCKDGNVRWLHSFCKCSEEEKDSAIHRLVGACRDITDRKRAENELVTLNAELEQRVQERTADLESFSYTVSHDLRAPLRAISGFCAILLDEHAGSLDSEGRRLLSAVRDNADRMKQLIDDLLSFSRVGRAEMNRFRVDMSELVRDVIDRLRADGRECVVQFSVGTLPAAIGDAAMIRQIWVNLLSNAMKFSRRRKDALVEVGAFSDTAETVYFVKDNGIGLDMEYAHKLFGIFQRFHSTNEFEGTGVGLAIVKLIVERHGGRVWAEGVPGEGATFYFTLPEEGS